uniref:Reverse transcriptase domain-containing protein n=1 Tax=Tanacetum cinerariifolium TaxID=118510 RepID=A0A6L2NVB8_TANCI|nr:reverse transcriptase domain-containing protein [Tanacetum cinerariifolium]
MSTRSSARNLFPPLDNPEHTIRRRSRADPTLLNDFEMATVGNGDPRVPDLWTMKELCQPSLNGREFLPIFDLLGDDANKHLDKFLYVTQSIKVNGVTDDTLRLYLFPHSLTHHATAWFDHLPRNSINTFKQMAKMFLRKYFPPSLVTKLRNEIINFRQRPNESLFKAWECYKLSIDRCPNHNMLPVTQIDTFYNCLTLRHHDSINDVAGGTFMKRRHEECYDLIMNMTAHHNDWDTSAQRTTISQTQNVYDAGAYQGNSYQPQGSYNLLSYRSDNYLEPPGEQPRKKPILPKCFTWSKPTSSLSSTNLSSSGLPSCSSSTLISQQQVVTTNEFTNYMKANDTILKNMQTNMTSLTNSNLELKNMFGQFMMMNTALSLSLRTLPSNTITNPKEDLKGITTRSGTAYQGPMIPTTSSSFSPVVECETKATKDTLTDALILMPKFGPTIKTLLINTDKLSEIARTPLNEHCLAILLKKLPEKLGDPGKFLIPYDFPGIDECLALADLSAIINLMPLLVWNKLLLPDLSLTCMTIELADHSISHPIGFAKDVIVKVGTFHFPADFVVVDFYADPRVPLILGRYFLITRRALIDVFEGEITFRVGKEAITFNLGQTSRYLANYNDMTANRIDVIDMACEEYSQEVLGFYDVIANGNPTTYYDLIVSTSFLTLTLFGESDFLLEEVDAFLALEDDPTLLKDD